LEILIFIMCLKFCITMAVIENDSSAAIVCLHCWLTAVTGRRLERSALSAQESAFLVDAFQSVFAASMQDDKADDACASMRVAGIELICLLLLVANAGLSLLL
jgi:hypothetical protein